LKGGPKSTYLALKIKTSFAVKILDQFAAFVYILPKYLNKETFPLLPCMEISSPDGYFFMFHAYNPDKHLIDEGRMVIG